MATLFELTDQMRQIEEQLDETGGELTLAKFTQDIQMSRDAQESNGNK